MCRCVTRNAKLCSLFWFSVDFRVQSRFWPVLRCVPFGLIRGSMKSGVLSAKRQLLGSSSLPGVLQWCGQHVSERLYVYLTAEASESSTGPLSTALFNVISKIYIQAFVEKPQLDVRVILGHLKRSHSSDGSPDLFQQVHVENALTDSEHLPFALQKGRNVVRIPPDIIRQHTDAVSGTTVDGSAEPEWKVYQNVVIGGTFDHLHAGHKILLTNAILRCRRKLTIGLTTQEMLKKKRLADLIQPIEERERILLQFCTEVDRGVEYDIQPISDPFGPSTVDRDLEAVVASEETRDGAQAINVEREKKGLSKLQTHIFPLHDVTVETSSKDLRTMSSSFSRQQMLGKLLKPPAPRPDLPRRPYLIGLTGGSGSGKSKIGQYLADRPGALHVDCDKLAHAAYKKGSPLHARLVAEFGSEILDNATGEIVRRELGRIVFNNENARQKLNSLVWPAVMEYCFEIVRKAGPVVAFFDAALLVEAGWGDALHEVWVTFVPEEEAVRRIVERDKVDEEAAKSRLKTQMSNRHRIEHANVVFCSLWDYSVTRAQVDNAWNDLQQRL